MIEKQQDAGSKISIFSKVIRWIDDIRNILLLASLSLALVFIHENYQDQSRVEIISNAANEYGPLISECLEQKSTLECLGQLKLVADTETYESVKSVALKQ